MNAEPMPPAISIVACLMAFFVSSAGFSGVLVWLSALSEHVPTSLIEVLEAFATIGLFSSKLLRREKDLLLHRHVRIIADAERPDPALAPNLSLKAAPNLMCKAPPVRLDHRTLPQAS